MLMLEPRASDPTEAPSSAVTLPLAEADASTATQQVPSGGSAGLHINLIADASVASAPSGFATAMRQAADIIEAAFSDPITLNIRYGWGTYDNQPDPSLNGGNFAEGGDNFQTHQTVSYSTLKSWLGSDATSSQDSTAIANLPSTVANSFYVTSAQLKALGHFSGSATDVDGFIGWGTGWTSNFIGGALHELTHAMGRIFASGAHYLMDLFRYDAAGHFQWTGARPAYLSVDGGATKLADFGVSSDYGDFKPGGVQGADPFNEIISGSNTLTAVDITNMDVIGFNRAGLQPAPPQPTDDIASSLTDTAHPFGVLAADGTGTGKLEVTGDHDWFRVQLTAGTSYVISLTGQDGGGGTLADPYLSVHNSSGTVVAQNDDIQDGVIHDSRVTYVPASSGTYYLDASAFNDGSAGTYRVSVSGAAVPPTNIPQTPAVAWSASVDVGVHPTSYVPAAVGDFNNDLTSDLVWYNAATRDLDLWKLGNGKWAGSVDIGTHPAGYQPLTTGDYNGDGSTDVLWFNASNGAVDIWKISNGQWAGSVSVGLHPAGYQPVGSGDFNGDGTTDVLWYNPSTGNTDIWKLSNAQWAGSTTIGAHPLGYTPAGIGDFDHSGTSDVLWFNPTTGDLDLWKVANGQWAGSVDIGAHPGGYAPAGVGDFNNDGTSDVLWFNAATGDAEVWLIANGHWSASVDLGAHPLGWSPAGVGDFNHDGTADIAWRETATNHVETWLLAHS
jgi:hypothetical protein